MSSSSEADSIKEESLGDQLNFVTLLQKYKVILQKSQIPSVRKAKEESLRKLQQEWELETGKLIHEKQLIKKIHNMKSKIKLKTDKSRTGNKRIKLNKWEQALFKLMEGDTNPTCVKIPGAIHAGVSLSTESTVPVLKDSSLPECSKSLERKTTKRASLPESEETRGLSTAELQRLVLLEQLEVLRLKKNKLLKEVQDKETYLCNDNTDCFFNL